MKKVLLLTVLILLLSSVYLFSAVPCKINYQGRLIKDNVPVNGTKTMKFSIYDSAVGGDELWTSGEVDVTVHNGLFRYVLDLSSIDDWTAGETLYLEVKVETDILTPREELYAYPYAINSHLLEGKTKEYFLDTSAGTQTKDGGLNIMGNVGIGTTAPTQKLDVAGNVKIRGRLAPTTLWPGFSLISPSDYWSGWQSNDRRWITGVTRAQADTGANVWDIEVYDDSSWQHMMELRGDGSAFFRGNVGIGTTSPGAKLEVAGNLRATGGIEPDWDSGWFNVGANTNYTKNHNLGTKDYTVLILYRKDASATYYNIASHYEQPYRVTWNGKKTGACVLEQGDNYILIRTGNWVNGIGFTDLNSKYYQTSGQYRILLWKF